MELTLDWRTLVHNVDDVFDDTPDTYTETDLKADTYTNTDTDTYAETDTYTDTYVEIDDTDGWWNDVFYDKENDD